MKSTLKKMSLVAALFAGLIFPAGAASAAARTTEQEVRHELLMLPYYSIFDQLGFEVKGDTVVLTGAVRRPTLKSDAQRVVERIEGVSKVVNQIEVLPLSPFDDRIRQAVARAIYRHPVLQRYAVGSGATIHIIVKNGNVTLSGVVANQMEYNVANIAANGVSGVFSVKNHLEVAPRG